MLGWPVRHSTPDITILTDDPTLGRRAELLFQRQQHTLLLACFVQLDDDTARALWAPAERRHPQVMHRLLERAVSRTARPGSMAAEETDLSRREFLEGFPEWFGLVEEDS